MMVTNDEFCSTIEKIVLKNKDDCEKAVRYLKQLKYPDGSMYISEEQAKVYYEVYLKYHYKTKFGKSYDEFKKKGNLDIKKSSKY